MCPAGGGENYNVIVASTLQLLDRFVRIAFSFLFNFPSYFFLSEEITKIDHCSNDEILFII